MPITKSELFKKRDIRTAEFAKVLGHPARVSILRELASRKECVCGEIVDVVPLAQATVSQHLKELKTVGLIKGEVEGVKSCYCIDPEGIRKLEKELMDLLADLKCGCEPGSC
ncbi:MAG: transcriptional regulator [Ignavibacteria bacterium RIFCSPLOWO2_02_FULL_55_14]|nr:MAG: transcriptional regulator [Ignavibacteria bacterium GWC2_56_12]OGU75118.1 MAG: transcriptional regulator [Ignavibacteria bacterium RIFCSPLOWO2_02_FULL_55_14]